MSTRFKIKWKISADEILKFDLSSDKILIKMDSGEDAIAKNCVVLGNLKVERIRIGFIILSFCTRYFFWTLTS